MKKKVGVAMSGGVDSGVAAALLVLCSRLSNRDRLQAMLLAAVLFVLASLALAAGLGAR